MGNEKKTRRSFFSILTSKEKKNDKTEKVKMLTPDGKLVEVDREIFNQATNKQKASNKDIYNWMNNPSKDNN
jgi:hypothetical protein